jgi:pimeloyl-ACP methyl ester carboxylesterase
MLAELIRLTTADQKIHYGAFYAARGANPHPLGVVMVHGMTGSFVGEIESAVPPLLAAEGFNVLVANNRGTGILGAATEDFGGCLPDIQAALDWMAERGFTRIALVGHSKGGVKVAYYLAKTGDSRVEALGLLSTVPGVREMPLWLSKQFADKKAKNWLKKSSKRAQKGKGARLYFHKDWPYLISAGTVADHFALKGGDVLKNLKKIKVPVLAACGSLELDWCTVVVKLHKAPPAGYLVSVVDGADHVYTGREKQLADLMAGWLHGLNV